MPRVIVTETAGLGLERCRQFLASKNPQAARQAGQAIEKQFLLLETFPGIGRPFADAADVRELVIGFGGQGMSPFTVTTQR